MRFERLLTPFVLLSVTAILVGTTIERSRSFDGTINFLAFFATTAAIYAVFALALNVQWGYTGIFNFGVAAFFLVGAYTAGIFTKPPADPEATVTYIGGFGEALSPPFLGGDQWVPFLVAILASAVASGFLAFLLAIPTLRLREDYLAITTIGIAELLRRIVIQEDYLVNGSRSLIGIPKPFSGYFEADTNRFVYLAVVLVVLAVVFLLVEHVIRSPWGRVLRALKEDEVATAASGKNVFAFKMQGFIIGAMIMGVGGAIFAFSRGSIGPTTFDHFFATFLFWAMLMVGGSGNNWGAIAGAYVVWAFFTVTLNLQLYDLPNILESRVSFIRDVLLGLLIVAVLLLRPQGLIPEERRVSLWLDRRMRQGERGESAPENTAPP
jgi:branched-chain amino acid transport system permease protein